MKLATLLLSVACGLPAQDLPAVKNAKVQQHSAASGLDSAFRAAMAAQEGAAWIGYSVPGVSERSSCGVCALEWEHGINIKKLEGPDTLLVLLRSEHGKVRKVRVFSEGCELDARGLPFHWISGVKPAESIHLLSTYARSGDDGALTAIALHKDSEADRVLETFLAPLEPEKLRKQTVFWMGSARGRRGYDVLDRVVRTDASTEVRSQAVFALSISPEPEALQAMIRTAKQDTSTHVRSQALFWLAQKAEKKVAAQAIQDAVENDPDTGVKKQAVFAVSQMPPDQGVPILIQLAQTNRNQEVRKQAMFWLGQSGDSRALRFFEDVLSK
jgi:hypothetical protein